MLTNIFNKNSLKLLTKTQTPTILLVTAFIMLTGNYSLIHGILNVYPLTVSNLPFLISLVLFFASLTAVFLLLVSYGRMTRWVLGLLLIVASQSAYYMDHLGVIIDMVMIDNIIQTNQVELASLMTASLFIRTILFGLIPAWIVIKYCPNASDAIMEIKSRVKAVLFFIGLIVVLIIPFTPDYTSFIREHKIVRFYANPTYSVYSAIKYLTQESTISNNSPLNSVANDAQLLDPPTSKNELIIMVVGETARADRFSLNGYERITNPLLAKEKVISFSNVSSCGTSTGVSVPCMFSSLGRKNYDKEKALEQENLLDVLKKNGIEVLWRDNNSDSKGVATHL